MTFDRKLAAEVGVWKAGQSLPSGPATADHFIMRRERDGWTIYARPVEGLHTTITGLTAGEANRRRQEMTDAGFVGKVMD